MISGVAQLLQTLLLVAALGLMTGCGRDPKADAKEILANLDVEQLRTEAALLYKELFVSRSSEHFIINENKWPRTFRKLRPLRVSAYPDGFAVVLQNRGDSESGVYVIPLEMDHELKTSPSFLAERIMDGIYWYDLRP